MSLNREIVAADEYDAEAYIAPPKTTPVANPPRLLEHYCGPMGFVLKTERSTICVPVHDAEELERFNDHLFSLMHPGFCQPHGGNC